jgi:hypothetical protein
MKKHIKILKSFLKDIGITKVRVRNSPNTECDMENNIIYFSKNWYNDNGTYKEYIDAMKEVYDNKKLDIKISLATFGFFHELGHIASKVELKNFDREFASYIQSVQRLPQNNIKENMRQYKNLKLEKLADKYGYAIYKTYENKAIKLDRQLQNAIGE